MEKEIQTLLFRLVVLLATALQSIREAPSPQALPSSSKLPERSVYDALAKQIHSDLVRLFSDTQKACTNLSLALRPSAKGKASAPSASEGSTPISPTAGLDKASLEAAKAQLTTIAEDTIPKLVFLAKKARSDARVYVAVEDADSKGEGGPKDEDGTDADDSDDSDGGEEDETIRKLREQVEKLGGHLFRAPASKQRAVPGLGLGEAWTKAVNRQVVALVEAVGGLARAFLDAKSRAAIDKAAAARAKAEGQAVISMPLTGGNESLPKSADEARQMALQATAKVWSVCDAVAKSLPADNRAAVRGAWKLRGEMMDDGWREIKEAAGIEGAEQAPGEQGATEEASSPATATGADQADPSDPLAGIDEDLALDEAGQKLAARFAPLLRLGRMLHRNVGNAHLVPKPAAGAMGEEGQQRAVVVVDFDELDEADEALQNAQDDLVAAVLYGAEEDFDLGLDDEEEESDDDEDDDDVEGDGAEGQADASARHLSNIREACQAYARAALELAKRSGAAKEDEEEGKDESEAQKQIRLCAEEVRKLAGRLEKAGLEE